MKEPLSECCNGCVAPVHPPSWVLCKACFDKLNEKMLGLLTPIEPKRNVCPLCEQPSGRCVVELARKPKKRRAKR